VKAVNDVSSRCVPLNQGGRSQRLEPCASKGARTVLRGGGAGNSASLPDPLREANPVSDSNVVIFFTKNRGGQC